MIQLRERNAADDAQPEVPAQQHEPEVPAQEHEREPVLSTRDVVDMFPDFRDVDMSAVEDSDIECISMTCNCPKCREPVPVLVPDGAPSGAATLEQIPIPGAASGAQRRETMAGRYGAAGQHKGAPKKRPACGSCDDILLPISVVHRQKGSKPKECYILHGPGPKKFLATQSVRASAQYLQHVQELAGRINRGEVTQISSARAWLKSRARAVGHRIRMKSGQKSCARE